MASSNGEQVYCTLLMSDSYLPGAAVLAHSLRDAGTTRKLAVLVTLDTLSAKTVKELKALYDYVIPVERIRTPNPANLYLMDRGDLAYAFTKIALWRQVRFSKIVYLDADVVALRAPDELFDVDVPFAAAPDVGWPDAFNTGVMVLTPNMGDYWALQTLAASGDSFDGADQGLLNQYYEHKNWHRLSFTYNCTPNAQYQWEPAYRHYKSNIKMVHFIGKDKPWSKGRESNGGVYNELLGRWWAVHDKHLRVPSVSNTEQTSHTSQLEQHISPPEQHVSTDIEFAATVTNIDSDIPSAELLISPSRLAEPEALTTSTKQPVPESRAPTEPFSAPMMSWDATLSEPPPESNPEAANFPSQTYTFSGDRNLFQAPQSYPEPPKGMWYEVPESKPTVADRPPPLFPWEKERRVPKATRVFAEDEPPPLLPTFSATTVTTYQRAEPEQPRVQSPQASFENSGGNAWDSVPGIESYVRSIMESQVRHGHAPSAGSTILSPTISRHDRRESLILTDFPTAVERPSLPVTPAPIHRPTFWGDERDETGELPAAEGVPDQVDWNPELKLEQLRRSSILEMEHLKQADKRETPLRALPEHSIPTPGPENGKVPEKVTLDEGKLMGRSSSDDEPTILAPKPISPISTTDKPILRDPNFGSDMGAIQPSAEE